MISYIATTSTILLWEPDIRNPLNILTFSLVSLLSKLFLIESNKKPFAVEEYRNLEKMKIKHLLHLKNTQND